MWNFSDIVSHVEQSRDINLDQLFVIIISFAKYLPNALVAPTDIERHDFRFDCLLELSAIQDST